MNKKTILSLILAIICILGFFYVIYNINLKINKLLDTVQRIEMNEIDVSEKTKELSIQTKQDVNNNKNISTTEIIQSSEEEEKTVNDESVIEQDANVEQENISYDGDNSGKGLSLLGKYKGLTYYNQADSRWANIMYSSIGDPNQTMKSSACGPTAAAIVVSSSKGSILPTTMASLFVDNNFRTARNGTAWAAYSFVADYFGFEEFYTTSNMANMLNYLKKDTDNDGIADYFVVASCAKGLFTTGGHYVVLVSDKNQTIRVFDPYLYAGKFNTASRRNAGVVVNGNNVYLTEESFKNYANYRNFWIYSNDNKKSVENNSGNEFNITKYVATQSANLNVRNSPGGSKIGSLKKGTQVNVIETNGTWSKISYPVSGWVSSEYLSDAQSNSSKRKITGYSTGKYKVTSNLNVRTGASTRYRRKNYKQLTSNARQQNRRLGGEYSGYRIGVICTVIKINGNWGLTKSGWICLDYCKKI